MALPSIVSKSGFCEGGEKGDIVAGTTEEDP